MTDQPSASTVTAPPRALASHAEAMDAARALGPLLRARVPEAERLRRLPAATVADLLESGLCGVMQPRRFGGSELGAETLIDVSVELAAQCASSGWVYMLWAAHMWLLALWPAAAQEEMFADPGMVASSVVSTAGPAGAGFAVDGCRCFHYGGRAREGERLVLMISFGSYYSAMRAAQPVTGGEKWYPGDTLRQLVLGAA